MDTLRVMLVDDHEVVRQGLRALLDAEDDIEVIGEADNGLSAVSPRERCGAYLIAETFDVVSFDKSPPVYGEGSADDSRHRDSKT